MVIVNLCKCARTCELVAESGGRAVARLAVGEPEEARPATLAPPADDVLLARALAAERLALEAPRALEVALARQRAVVVVHRQREYALLAEI